MAVIERRAREIRKIGEMNEQFHYFSVDYFNNNAGK
jgi:hypothetical protein